MTQATYQVKGGSVELRSALATEIRALRAKDRSLKAVRPLLRAGRAYYISGPEDWAEITDMAAQVEVDHAEALATQYERARDARMAVQQAQTHCRTAGTTSICYGWDWT